MSILLRVFVFLAAAWLAFLAAKLVRLWFRARMLEVPVPMSVLVRLELGKVGAAALLDSYIAARRGGLDITLGELEQLRILGGNPSVVVHEMISAKASGKEQRFREVANQHLANQPGNVISLQRRRSRSKESGQF